MTVKHPHQRVSQEPEAVAERFRVTLDLMEAGILIMRQNIVRKYPEATPEEVVERLQALLIHRPGAEHCDGPSYLRKREWR